MKQLMVIIMFMFSNAFAASGNISSDNRIDGMRPDAPELAAMGNYNIGVRSDVFYHQNQIDVLNINEEEDFPYYDRPLPVEIWYPAETMESGGEYKDVFLRDGKTKATLYGSAVRGAKPLKKDTKFPLIIISHGYPGNRYLMSHFGENLASKGYIVVSIDHTDSLYNDAADFSSTLYNRPRDQKFVLMKMDELNQTSDHFLNGMVDSDNAGLIGYSMGGYGAVINAGGNITEMVAGSKDFSPKEILNTHTKSDEFDHHMSGLHFKAIMPIGPWGKERGIWDDAGLSNATVPMFVIGGSQDDTSGYENGIKAIYDKSVNADRYLLTFENAGHNAAAPIPAPKETGSVEYPDSERPLYGHYADAVWDTLRMNNIAQHYATAYFGKMLKKQNDMERHLMLFEDAKGLKLDHAPAQ